MKCLVLAILIICCQELATETQKTYKFEPSLVVCRKPDITEYLSEGKCVFDTKHAGPDFLCKYHCDTNGHMKLKECQINTYKSSRPLCDELFCLEVEEVFPVELNSNDRCKYLTNWDSNLICTYRCDHFNFIRLVECNSNYIDEDLQLCQDLHCTSRSPGN